MKCLFSIFAWLAMLALVLAIQAPAPAPPEPNVCPVFPVPSPGAPCGPYTSRYCDSITETCPFCLEHQGLALTAPNTEYPLPPKAYLLDAGDYLFYHMLQVEYLVEFSKNPMPYQKKVHLPYCGLDKSKASVKRRGIKWPEVKVGGTWGQIGENIKEGIARINFPWVDNDPPAKPGFNTRQTPNVQSGTTFLPRPVCIPTSIRVPVHFTLFTTNYTTASLVTATVLQSQLELANKAFEPLQISFYMASLSSHIGTEWARFTQNKNGGDGHYYQYAEDVKGRYRYGGNDEVNVWIVEAIDQPNCTTGVITAGYCTLARSLTNAEHPVDGCAITIDSLPGIAWRGPRVGDGRVLTHELGHWFDLPHVFSDKEGCPDSGDSDGVGDTYQFPNNPDHLFDFQQPRCCPPSNSETKYNICDPSKQHNVANYMSYSGLAGQWNPSDDAGTQPWTAGQRARMYTSFFTLRRPPPRRVGDATFVYEDCEKGYYPIWRDQSPSETRQLFRRKGKSYQPYRPYAENSPVTTRDLHGYSLFAPGRHLLEHLQEACSKPPASADAHKFIDVISGEAITCSPVDGTCQPPQSGARCPDGTKPPCQMGKYCADGSLANPNCPTFYPCSDGTMPPCSNTNGINSCPDSNHQVKSSTSRPPSPPTSSTPQPPPSQPPGPPATNAPKPSTRPGGVPDYGFPPSTCPAGCNPHSNKCDATTAPTCIFPDPRVSKPRAACACRPGFKSSWYGDWDTSKQWRLPIPGQEHRVWVAEGVVCDKECVVSAGTGACREVGEVPGGCVGY